MLQIQTLTIQGFKSFISPQTIDFSSQPIPSFIFLTGENQVEPRLGANGVGKSSIFDALTWVLYGKTPIGLRASNIQNWKEKEPCLVELKFKIKNKEYTLTRTFNPNSVTLIDGTNTITLTQDQIDKLVGLNFISFCYSVLISQFSSKFFDLAAFEKLAIFTEVLGLDKWLEYSDKSKNRTLACNLQIQELKKEQANKEGKIQILKKQDYSKESAQWGKDYQKRVQATQDHCAELIESSANLGKDLEVLTKNLKNLEIDKVEVEKLVLQSKTEEQKTRKLISEVQLQLKEVTTSKKLYAQNLEKIKKLNGGNCPTCSQLVSGEYIGQVEQEYLNLLEPLEKTELEYKDSLQGLANQLEVLLFDSKEIQESHQKVVQDLSNLTYEFKSKQKALNTQNLQVDKLNVELERLSKEVNPFLNIEKKIQYGVKIIQRFLNYLQEDIGELTQDYDIYKYWEKGFREIRLLVLEEVMKEFEILININLKKLGLVDWEIKLAVDKENKSGGVKKGFTILVKSPTNKTLVPFECWSGGEGQRLRLAGTLSFMDLIFNRTSVKWNIEVFDEPTQFLSMTGINDLLDSLRARAHSNNKQLYIIDHRDFNTYGSFTDTIKVVKTKNGSTLKQGG